MKLSDKVLVVPDASLVPQFPVSNRVQFSRREITQMLLTAGLGFLINGCSSSENTHTAPQAKEAPPSAIAENQPILLSPLEQNDMVGIPSYTLTNTPSVVQKIPEISLNEKELAIAAARLAEVTRQGFDTRYIPNARQYPNNLDQVALDFMDFLFTNFRNIQTPLPIREAIGKYLSNPGYNPAKLVPRADFLNQFLIPGGYYLDVGPDFTTGKPFVNLYTITRHRTARAQHKDLQVTAPIFYLDQPHLPEEKGKNQGPAIALSDLERKRILYYPSRLERETRNIMMDLSQYPRFSQPITDDQIWEFGEECLGHEIAGHFILARLFPKVAGHLDPTKLYPIETRIQVGEKALDLRYSLPNIVLHELASIGKQLATNGEYPLAHGFFLTRTASVAQDQLTPLLLSFATLQAATDSPLKTNILREIVKTGQIRIPEVIRLMSTAPFTINDTRRTGEILFRFACEKLRQLEEKAP